MIPRSFTKVKSGKIVKLTVVDKPEKYTVDNSRKDFSYLSNVHIGSFYFLNDLIYISFFA